MHVKNTRWVKFLDLPTKKYLILLISLLFVVSIYSFIFKPFLISTDSMYGFLAYKGSLHYHALNVVAEVSPQNVSQTNLIFQSWWSPGQWIFPGSLQYLFGARLGIASLIVSILFAIGGFWGFFRLFCYFQFPVKVSAISLLILFCSSTFYESFITYQGGEILEFGIFPWFLLFVVRIQKVTVAVLLSVTALFLICFIAKITLLLYCIIALLFQSFQLVRTDHVERKVSYRDGILLLLPPAFCMLIIKLFFLSKGPSPTLIRQLNVSPEDLLIPLSSPLNSILSVQQWIIRFERLLYPTHLESFGRIFANGCYTLLFAMVIAGGYVIYRQKKIDEQYKGLLLFLYAGICIFFIFSYALDTNISYNSRHFKLLGFFSIPGCLSVLQGRLPNRAANVFVLLVCLLTLSDIYYGKQKRTRNRYVSINYFYRNADNPSGLDELDSITYRRLIEIDQRMSPNGDNSVIFYIEGNMDLLMDIQHSCIIQLISGNPLNVPFHGKGPRIVACISKKTIAHYPNLLKMKFPDYDHFGIIGETERYSFFESMPER